MSLSVLMLIKNNEHLVKEALESVDGLWDELLISDDES